MSDIFEEVEESVRQDKVAEAWAKYGIFVWILGFLIIGSVAYMEYSKVQKAKAVEASIEEFEAARGKLTAGEYADAQAEFKNIVDSKGDIAPLASHYLARAYYEGSGDAAAAADILETASDLEGPVQRLGLLKSAYLRADNMSLPELETYLGDLPKESTALGVLALELIAAKALKEGDIERARQEFSYIRFAPNVPAGVSRRAEIALSIIPVPVVAEPTDTSGAAATEETTQEPTETTEPVVLEQETEQ